MPRFAILEHDHPYLHWDLLLERGDSCRTWRLAAPLDVAKAIAAEALPDHRLMYLDYEGPISGNRGRVTQWDAGDFRWITQTDQQVAVQLIGQRWSGIIDLSLSDGAWTAKRT